jgi:CheY-like chemotaxis protein
VRIPVAREAAVVHRSKWRDAPTIPPLRVLIVDDNQDAAAALDLLLRELGHRTMVLYGGIEALAKIDSFAPDCVFLDLGMPDLDGYEVAKRVRAEAAHQPWLIALTGWGQDDDRARTRAAGFDAHLVKPVTTDDIVRTLAYVAAQGRRVMEARPTTTAQTRHPRPARSPSA